ncbi:MAG: hypothetical protein JSV92_02010 [archaeon]|nr:MAG: hypothetical protein JSV92_02010 [archaeon]
MKIIEKNYKIFLEKYNIADVLPIKGDFPVALAGGNLVVFDSMEENKSIEENVLYLLPLKNDGDKKVGIFKSDEEIKGYREK